MSPPNAMLLAGLSQLKAFKIDLLILFSFDFDFQIADSVPVAAASTKVIPERIDDYIIYVFVPSTPDAAQTSARIQRWK